MPLCTGNMKHYSSWFHQLPIVPHRWAHMKMNLWMDRGLRKVVTRRAINANTSNASSNTFVASGCIPRFIIQTPNRVIPTSILHNSHRFTPLTTHKAFLEVQFRQSCRYLLGSICTPWTVDSMNFPKTYNTADTLLERGSWNRVNSFLTGWTRDLLSEPLKKLSISGDKARESMLSTCRAACYWCRLCPRNSEDEIHKVKISHMNYDANCDSCARREDSREVRGQ